MAVKKRKQSLGGAKDNDVFAIPVRKYAKQKRRRRALIRNNGTEKQIARAEYWMDEHRLKIIALGGTLQGATVLPWNEGKDTPAMKAAREILAARKRARLEKIDRKKNRELSLGD